MCMYVYIYIYICIHIHNMFTCIYAYPMYIHMYIASRPLGLCRSNAGFRAHEAYVKTELEAEHTSSSRLARFRV